IDIRPGDDGHGPTVAADVADEFAVAAAFALIREQFGDPNVLVNCAGVTGNGSVLDESPDQWRRILNVNLTSAYLCAREVIPGMRAAGGGKILNVASVNGRFGGSALSGPAYAASKGGLLTLTRFLAREHAKDGIQANAVAPGPHDTPMWDALEPALRQRILGMLPGGNGPGEPADLAQAVVFLCSPAAAYITGATLDINGGQWMG
ncbi:MAG: SDR family oxidoreductase, partial [Actinomycetota bacterium]|nr:SDR family oxidoreductase [Actinomycetota bacterium]